MLLRKSLVAAAALAGGAAGLLLVNACSNAPSPSAPSGAEGGTGQGGATLTDPTCTDGGLTIAFNPMYSAYDGKHTFEVPAVVFGSSGSVTWFADPSMVGMQADPERPNEVLITTLAAGTTTIHVQSDDGKCASAPLYIAAASESDWEIGNARYNDGVSLHPNATPSADDASPLEPGGTGGPACTSCHGETATNGPFTDVSHTPEQTAGFSDDDMVNIVVNGTFPPNGVFDWNIVSYPVWQNFHRWTDITSDQQKGIVVYLRSLTPAPQKGEANFGYFDSDAATNLLTFDGGSSE